MNAKNGVTFGSHRFLRRNSYLSLLSLRISGVFRYKDKSGIKKSSRIAKCNARECFSVADIIRYAAQHIGVVGDDAVYAPGDHIFHVLLVIYRPGVDLHAPAVEQFHQLRLILQKHIPGMHIVGIGALDIMFHVQIGLIIQKAGFNVRAQLLEMLHGDMVEGGNEHLLLHLAFADFVDHPLLQFS